MSLPESSTRATLAFVAVSLAVAASVVRATLRYAVLSETELPWYWWAPSLDFFLRPSLAGWSIFLSGVAMLVYGVRRRSHALVAVGTSGTVLLTYLLMLDRWTQRPGAFIDPRIMYTILFALVPLYVSVLALGAHVWIWRASSRAEPTFGAR